MKSTLHHSNIFSTLAAVTATITSTSIVTATITPAPIVVLGPATTLQGVTITAATPTRTLVKYAVATNISTKTYTITLVSPFYQLYLNTSNNQQGHYQHQNNSCCCRHFLQGGWWHSLLKCIILITRIFASAALDFGRHRRTRLKHIRAAFWPMYLRDNVSRSIQRKTLNRQDLYSLVLFVLPPKLSIQGYLFASHIVLQTSPTIQHFVSLFSARISTLLCPYLQGWTATARSHRSAPVFETAPLGNPKLVYRKYGSR